MKRLPLTSAAAALFRALAGRAGLAPERALITDVSSVDWHSLTLDGERHHFALRLAGEDADKAALALCAGLDEAEFDLAGWIVADIAVTDGPLRLGDGSVAVTLEALTIRE